MSMSDKTEPKLPESWAELLELVQKLGNPATPPLTGPRTQPFPFVSPQPYIGPNTQIIGTCSLCGGPVTLPLIWGSVVPPTPTCAACGALPARGFGPVIDMRPGPEIKYTTTSNSVDPTKDQQ